MFLALSKASKTNDEAHPFPTVPFAQGHAASFVGPGWQFGYALDPKAGNPKLKPVMGAFPMPSHIPGRSMPGFLGGSDLAIPAASQNQDLARQWIADFTSNASMAGIVKAGNLPNTTALLGPGQGHAGLGARRVREGDLVRPDRQELGERRELQRPPDDALEHRHGQAVGRAGRQVDERPDHQDPQLERLSSAG